MSEENADGDPARSGYWVLSGTEGVGKTQLAARCARGLWRSGAVDLLVWVKGATREAIEAAYGRAAAKAAVTDGTDLAEAATEFLNWLETTPERWLLVLDDVPDPADLGSADLLPAPGGNGRILVTTRRRDAALAEGGRRVEVGVLPPDAAGDYLVAKLAAHGRREPRERMRALATDLGCLPLALSQASAYMIDLALDGAEYRARLADEKRRLHELVPGYSGLPDGQQVPVAATWRLAIEHADRLRPAGMARGMLELVAMLDADGIPAAVLSSPTALNYVTDRRDARFGGGRPSPRPTAEDAAQAVRALHRLSLIDHDPDADDRAVRVHGLVQRAVREELSAAEYRSCAIAAADAVLSAWKTARDAALVQALRDNAGTVIARAGDALYRGARGAVHPLVFRTGQSLGREGQRRAAFRHFRRAVTQAGRVLAPTDLGMLALRIRLAYWQEMAGSTLQAADAFRRLLADQQRVLGPADSRCLVTRSSLARLRGKNGDPHGAVRELEEILAEQRRRLPPDHPDVRATRSTLATWRGRAGDLAGAVEDFEELLRDQRRLLHPDDERIRITLDNLASWQAASSEGRAASEPHGVESAESVRDADGMAPVASVAVWDGDGIARFADGRTLDCPADSLPVLLEQLRHSGPTPFRNAQPETEFLLALTRTAVLRLGLPELVDDDRGGPRLPHPAVTPLLEAGWELTDGAFTYLTRLHRGAETDRVRVRIAVLPWGALSALGKPAPPLRPGELARFLGAFATWVDGDDGAEPHLLPSLPVSTPDSGHGVGRDGPYRAPMLKPGLLTSTPTGTSWHRTPTRDEAAVPWVVGLYAPHCLLGAARSAPLGIGPAVTTEEPVFDRRTPGWWLVDLSDTPLDPLLPNPFRPVGEVTAGNGPAWHPTAAVAYAQELGMTPRPLRGRVYQTRMDYVSRWAGHLREAFMMRLAACGFTAEMTPPAFLSAVASLGEQKPEQVTGLEQVEQTLRQGLTRLRPCSCRGGRERDGVGSHDAECRSLLYESIAATARVGMHRRVRNLAEATGRRPLAVYTDFVIYPATEPSVMSVLPHAHDGTPQVDGTFRLGPNTGMAVQQGVWPMRRLLRTVESGHNPAAEVLSGATGP